MYVVRLLGDNREWKEGGTLMGFTFLMKAASPKWECLCAELTRPTYKTLYLACILHNLNLYSHTAATLISAPVRNIQVWILYLLGRRRREVC